MHAEEMPDRFHVLTKQHSYPAHCPHLLDLAGGPATCRHNVAKETTHCPSASQPEQATGTHLQCMSRPRV